MDGQDKPWIAVDNFPGDGYGNVYLVTRHYFQVPGGYNFDILLTRSTDDGLTWGPSRGTTIVSPSPDPTLFMGPNVTVGADHAVYVSWWQYARNPAYTGQIMMRKSTDQGVSFGDPVTVTKLNTPYYYGSLLLKDSGGQPRHRRHLCRL